MIFVRYYCKLGFVILLEMDIDYYIFVKFYIFFNFYEKFCKEYIEFYYKYVLWNFKVLIKNLSFLGYDGIELLINKIKSDIVMNKIYGLFVMCIY